MLELTISNEEILKRARELIVVEIGFNFDTETYFAKVQELNLEAFAPSEELAYEQIMVEVDFFLVNNLSVAKKKVGLI